MIMTKKMCEKNRPLFQRRGVFVVLSIFLLLSLNIPAIGSTAHTAVNQHAESRTDIVKFNVMNAFEHLERPPVLFAHEAHVDALEKVNKDCTECHKSKDDKLAFLFLRLKDEKVDTQQIIDDMHDKCIACHKERIGRTDQKSGPVACAECHLKKPLITSERQPVGMDKSLHYRHTDTLEKAKVSPDENICDRCHHEYDKEAKKLIHPKNKEATCRYCHKEVEQDNTSSMEVASHAYCVNCHVERQKKKEKENGPVKCSGCHDLAKQQQIKKVDPVPRIERKQPDMVMIKTGDKALDQPEKPEKKTRMDFVPFNHKAHEELPYTCKECHHAEISSCNKCHTLMEAKDGGNITLAQAMHDPRSIYSCVGCHNKSTEDKNCAGCHTFMSVVTGKQSITDAFCLKCHMEQPAGIESDVIAAISGSVAPGSDEYESDVIAVSSDSVALGSDEYEKAKDAKIAEILLSGREQITATYEKDDIPEKLELKLERKGIEPKYKPAQFPHRKIVDSIVKKLKENKLAGYFHNDKGTVCNGCHHNSPVTKKPSKCANCHGIISDNNLDKPGIIGAYHRQCMGCHDVMKVEKSGKDGAPGRLEWSCTDCHEKKEI